VISCISGALWITQENDLQDYNVEAGEVFWVTKPGTIIVQAMDNAQFKYSLNELQNHIEINQQPMYQRLHSRVSRLLR
jgi:Protein of unknown function (DUF2917)